MEEESKDEEALLKEFFAEISATERDNEVERVLNCFKLNPFDQLNLRYDATPTDVKKQYRKVSLMIHPDKCKHEKAQEAFNIIQKAQELLLKAEEREYLDHTIAEAKEVLLKDRRKKLKKDTATQIKKIMNDGKEPVDEYEFSEEFRELWRAKVKELLVENEWRRRKIQKRMKEEEQRIEKGEAEEKKKAEAHKKHSEKWEQTRDNRVSSWRDFQKGSKKKAAKETKPPRLKTEDPEKSYVQRPVKRG